MIAATGVMMLVIAVLYFKVKKDRKLMRTAFVFIVAAAWEI